MVCPNKRPRPNDSVNGPGPSPTPRAALTVFISPRNVVASWWGNRPMSGPVPKPSRHPPPQWHTAGSTWPWPEKCSEGGAHIRAVTSIGRVEIIEVGKPVNPGETRRLGQLCGWRELHRFLFLTRKPGRRHCGGNRWVAGTKRPGWSCVGCLMEATRRPAPDLDACSAAEVDLAPGW